MLYLLLSTGTPSIPQDLRLVGEPAQAASMSDASVTIQWTPGSLQMDTTYIVTVTPSLQLSMTSIFQTPNTSIVLTIPYNVQHNVSVIASNCAEISTAGTISVLVGKHISNSLGSLVNKYSSLQCT